MRHTRGKGGWVVAVLESASIASALVAMACDGVDPGTETGGTHPTATVWLAPVAATNAEGRFTMVLRADGVHVTGRGAGLTPSGQHQVAIYDVERCGRVEAGRPVDVLAWIDADREGRFDYEAMHSVLGFVGKGDEGVAGRTLVLESLDGEDGSATPVACGRVRLVGDLAYASD